MNVIQNKKMWSEVIYDIKILFLCLFNKINYLENNKKYIELYKIRSITQSLTPSQINVYTNAKYKCNICGEVSTKLGYQ